MTQQLLYSAPVVTVNEILYNVEMSPDFFGTFKLAHGAIYTLQHY